MAILTSSTTIQVLEPAEVYENSVDLTLLPANAGAYELRKLKYPGGTFPDIVYDQNPEWWDNFDTGPLTNRPIVGSALTIKGSTIARWPGYIPDRTVKEYWRGDENTSFMTMDMLRKLWEYFSNPPSSGRIEWWPRDRTTKGYYIEIVSLTVGGSDGISMNLIACQNNIVLKEVVLEFFIISEI